MSKYWPPSEKGSTLKGKNLLARTNSFLLEKIPFQKEFDAQEKEVTKIVSLVKSTLCFKSP